MATDSRRADANGVLKLAEERLQSSRPPVKADQPSRDLASCVSQVERGTPGQSCEQQLETTGEGC